MSQSDDIDEVARLVTSVLDDMEKHFSQEQDERWHDWDIEKPHVRLGRPQEVHGRRPGKRKMVLALRAAAKAQGEGSKIPKWNTLIAMRREDVYRIGKENFGSKFDDMLERIKGDGAGDTPKVDEVPNSVARGAK